MDFLKAYIKRSCHLIQAAEIEKSKRNKSYSAVIITGFKELYKLVKEEVLSCSSSLPNEDAITCLWQERAFNGSLLALNVECLCYSLEERVCHIQSNPEELDYT
ncbi:hypothetical protein RJT34_02051 [Clitoria ternatea]|uniref:Uncharacterized protein n=1 Tax=Clitoria ternatea TaxID=43366 RepID=A0AAN9Q0R8_CLITE